MLINPCKFGWDPAWVLNLHAINHYRGCGFACSYCWAKELATRSQRLPSTGNWQDVEVVPKFAKPDLTWRIAKETQRLPNIVSILLSATCDPYTPLERKEFRTTLILMGLQLGNRLRKADGKEPIQCLILTKGLNAEDIERDYTDFKALDAQVGFTLTAPSGVDTKPWEPYAPSNRERIEALKKLHGEGIKTFASIEPWLAWTVYPFLDITQPICIVEETQEFVDYYILGSWNKGGKPLKPLVPFYQKELPKIIEALEKSGKPFWVKPELKEVL